MNNYCLLVLFFKIDDARQAFLAGINSVPAYCSYRDRQPYLTKSALQLMHYILKTYFKYSSVFALLSSTKLLILIRIHVNIFSNNFYREIAMLFAGYNLTFTKMVSNNVNSYVMAKLFSNTFLQFIANKTNKYIK